MSPNTAEVGVSGKFAGCGLALLPQTAESYRGSNL